jgi:hypothetical protein
MIPIFEPDKTVLYPGEALTQWILHQSAGCTAPLEGLQYIQFSCEKCRFDDHMAKLNLHLGQLPEPIRGW